MKSSCSRTYPLIAALIVGWFIAACGGDDGAAPIDAATGGIDAPGSSTTASAMIGAAGGTLRVDGAVLTIPPAALTSAVLITLTRTAGAPPAEVVDATPLYQLLPVGQTFAVPVSLALTFPSAPPAAVAMFWSKAGVANPTTVNDYDRLAVTVVGNTVTASNNHFSNAAAGRVVPADPTAGFAFYGVTFGANGAVDSAGANALLDMPLASANQLTAFEDYLFTGIPLGACARFMFPNPGTLMGADVGPTMELRNGATTVLTLTRGAMGLYAANAPAADGLAALGTTLALSAPGAATVVPNLLPGLVVMPPRTGLTAPAAGVVVTRGQPLTVTWSPIAADTMMIYTIGGVGCRVDPTTGSFVIPGAATALEHGTSLALVAMNRRIVAVTIGGAARSVLGYGQLIHVIPVTFQGGGG